MAEKFSSVLDFQNEAEQILPEMVLNNIQTGSLQEETLQENIAALKRYKIVPRILRDVSARSTKTTILGYETALPVGFSPCSPQVLTHKDGEMAAARVAEHVPTVMTLSDLASFTVRELVEELPDLLCFCAVRFYRSKSVTYDVVKSVEKWAKALVVIGDMPVLGRRTKMGDGYGELFSKFKFGNSALQDQKQKLSMSELSKFFCVEDSTWENITWLKSISKLPIIIKGIVTAEDAILALQYGADAIWVSNHGGRQLDSTRSTIDALPEIVKAVGGKCEVYVDGGFRTGVDVFKGLALGARAVFIGRPVHYGLACGGEDGLRKMMEILQVELDNTMALSGCCSVSDITSDYLRKHVLCNL